jgi:2-polyprenyl-3-methyl-5-hydroxy-6-metoxy-1,4-benzoquinol methylase
MHDLTRRVVAAELMDTEPQSVESLEAALRFLAFTNRRFGGYALLLRRFDSWSRHWNPRQPVEILDVGTGGADVPLALVRWAKRRGVRVRVTAVDIVPGIADIARARTADVPEIVLVTNDVLALFPKVDANGQTSQAAPVVRFDYVIACLFLHHVDPADTVAVVRQLARLAIRGLIISDLRRTWPGYLAVAAASRLLGNAVVRHDGPLSVRRAFTVSELRDLARQAGVSWLGARKERWFRVSLAGERRRES